MIFYFLTHPLINEDERRLIILYFEIVAPEFEKNAKALVTTFFRYLASNDPSQKFCFLRHQKLTNPKHMLFLSQLKNYVGESPSPVSQKEVEEKCVELSRGQVICKRTEEFRYLFWFDLSIAGSFDFSEQQYASNNLYISEKYFNELKAKHKQSSEDIKHFQTSHELEKYLKDEELESINGLESLNCPGKYNLLSNVLVEEFVHNRFTVYGGVFYLTIEAPFSYAYEKDDKIYVFIRTKQPNTYILFMDDVFEEENATSNIVEKFMSGVENHPVAEIFTNSHEGSVITIPLIQKEAEIKMNDGNIISLKIDLVWEEYLKGVREIDEDKITAEMIAPFYLGLVDIVDSRVRYRYFS